jgi:class 3 adenylate cyclase
MNWGSTYEPEAMGRDSILESIDGGACVAGHSTHEEEESPRNCIAAKETKAVSWLRVTVFGVLVIGAIVVSVVSYFFLSDNEQDDFETAYYDQATRVVDAVLSISQRRMATLQSFVMTLTSHALFSNSSTWPEVTLPDYERQAMATAQLASAMSIATLPLVKGERRFSWDAYSVANQGWLQEGLNVQRHDALEVSRQLLQRTTTQQESTTSRNLQTVGPIPEFIYKNVGGERTKERGAGPFLPQWQFAPALPFPELVNLNLPSHPDYFDSLEATLATEQTIMGRSLDFSDPEDEAASERKAVFDLFVPKWEEHATSYGNDPVADVHIPIFDTYDPESRELVGILTSVIYWRTYFENIIADRADIVVVLDNTCEQMYTYQITGNTVGYLGSGDRHDRQFDKFKVATEAGSFLGGGDGGVSARDVDGGCLYSIRVYPSQDLKDEYITRKPVIYTVIVIMVFLFISAVFVFYDMLVERRQRLIMNKAVASSAIVSSLFPKQVRDRLYDQDNAAKQEAVPSETNKQSKGAVATFLEGDTPTEGAPEAAITTSRPIADLFDDCTVLFADIAGFTSWSSGREPTDVFFLLETIYSAFDKIANKRKVFKVETIGDCYLAVTGLPEPRTDHAMIMAMFTHECARKMKALMAKELRNSLGGDTATLSMRFGMHSGPVTAGVLRGEKSRFQLFGDTVNTAARMESTGRRNRTHLSQVTADLLVAAGKSHWLEERPDLVQAAKGKDLMQTYWLRPRAYMPSRDAKRNAILTEAVLVRRSEAESLNNSGTHLYIGNNDLEEEANEVQDTHAAVSDGPEDSTSTRQAWNSKSETLESSLPDGIAQGKKSNEEESGSPPNDYPVVLMQDSESETEENQAIVIAIPSAEDANTEDAAANPQSPDDLSFRMVDPSSEVV